MGFTFKEFIAAARAGAAPLPDPEQWRHFDFDSLVAKAADRGGITAAPVSTGGGPWAEKLPVPDLSISVGSAGEVNTACRQAREGLIYGPIQMGALRHTLSGSLSGDDVFASAVFNEQIPGVAIEATQGSTHSLSVSIDIEADQAREPVIIRLLTACRENARLNITFVVNVPDTVSVPVLIVRDFRAISEGRITIDEAISCPGAMPVVISDQFTQESGAQIIQTSAILNGKALRYNKTVGLQGSHARHELGMLVLGRQSDLADIQISMQHNAPDCESSQLIKSIVSDNAVSAFTGRVLVAQGAQRTAAYQQSRGLQLSDTSRIYTEPQLEIYADDVKCSHGATVGQMDDQAVYYMRQRGISETDARKLQLSGFLGEVISKCSSPEFCQVVQDAAFESLKLL